MPIVTLLLTAKPDDILIIENPEAQLHPSGQAKLAELMSLVASHGVQLIVETHSDHIINGVRVATKNNVIAPEQSCINFFYRKEGELATSKEEIRILADGGVDKWPQGFFDEWDNQLDKLLW